MKTHVFRGFGRESEMSVGVDLAKVCLWKGIQGQGMQDHFIGTEIIMDNGVSVQVGESAIDVARVVESHRKNTMEALDDNVTARA